MTIKCVCMCVWIYDISHAVDVEINIQRYSADKYIFKALIII